MTIRVSGKFLITFAQSANSDIQDPKSPNVEYQAPWPFSLQTWSRGEISRYRSPNARNIYLARPVYIHFLVFDCHQASAGRLTKLTHCAAESLNIKRLRSETVQAHR